jgi:hypothetical protein
VRPSWSALACTLALDALEPRYASASPVPEGVDVHIACDALDAGERGALEARARAALTLREQQAGALAVSCDERKATLTWSPVAGPAGTRTVQLASDGPATTDALLAALDGLIDRPEPAAVPTTEEDAPTPDAETFSPARITFPRYAAVAGADGQIWTGSVPIAAGGHVGVRAPIASSWSAWLTGGLVWGTSAPESVHAKAVRAGLGVDDRIADRFRIGAGAVAMILFGDRSVGGSTASGEDWSLGGKVSAAYAVSFGHVAFSAGPEVQGLFASLEVRTRDGEVFRIPSVTAGFGIEVEAGSW